jgi:hypothetical protein
MVHHRAKYMPFPPTIKPLAFSKPTQKRYCDVVGEAGRAQRPHVSLLSPNADIAMFATAPPQEESTRDRPEFNGAKFCAHYESTPFGRRILMLSSMAASTLVGSACALNAAGLRLGAGARWRSFERCCPNLVVEPRRPQSQFQLVRSRGL